MKPSTLYRFALIAITCSTLANTAAAHMPWLATDDQGHAVMWFGESPADRTYHMPEKVAAIELTTGKSAFDTQPVDTDSLRGIRSEASVDSADEVSGVVTYGLYHGTKLTYHVEHLPQTDSSLWPSQPRPDAPLQSVITALPAGGASVTILRDGKPAKDVEVKLYCEEGHEEASAKTDIAGIVTFAKSDVEPGLNAIVVGLTDEDAKGSLDGVGYTSTTDYLTATFRIAGDASHKSKAESKAKQNSNVPKLDANSRVSIVPTNLPELPESLTSFGAAIADGKIYVYGGHTGSAHSYSIDEQSNRAWCLDTTEGENGTWKPLPSGPALQGLALVAHGNRVIRIGGFTAVNAAGEDHNLQSQDDVAAYDSATGAWTDLPSLPEPRSSLDAAVLGDKVFVFGGWKLSGESDNSQWHKTAWSLDLADASATWQPIATPPFQRRAMSVAAYDGKLFVIGGMNSDGKPTTKVNVYDPSSDSWSDGPSLPGSGMSGFGSASFATGGQLYVSTMDGFVHQLAGDQQSWATVAKSDPARFFHRMLPTSEKELLMIGGANMEIGKFTQIDRIELP
ncbi:MAG: kelch repeat-containing protein [Rubripirellula sp.]